MPRTYFQDFTRDDGSPVTVEYSVVGSYSPTTYSPINGAVGGDAPEISIVKCWPNTPEYNAIVRELDYLETTSKQGKSIRELCMMAGDEDRQERVHELGQAVAEDEERARLTDAERERMEAWLFEHYVEESDDDYDF